jgi:Protein of unknown function (DUF3300)
MRANMIRLVASAAIAAVVDMSGAQAQPTAPLPVVHTPGQPMAPFGLQQMGPQQSAPQQIGSQQIGPQQIGPGQLGPQQLGPRQLDPMLAPIALYPDQLIAQILAAATYPLEVVEADRWVQQPDHAALQGAQLAAALDAQAWDPSVKSLVPFAPVLRVMDGNLDWTRSLGEAFAADPAAVMDSVQRLRRLAQASGQLRSTPQLVVTNQASPDLAADAGIDGTLDGMPAGMDPSATDGTAGGIVPDTLQGTADGTLQGLPQVTTNATDDQPPIMIEPAVPDTVYVPVYDPAAAYGPWPYPGYPPFGFPDYADAFGGYGWFGVPVIASLWGWDRWDWRRHRIAVDRNRWTALAHRPWAGVNGTWHHGPFRTASIGRPFAPVGALPRVVTPRVGFPATQPFARGGRFEAGPAARVAIGTPISRGAGVRFAPSGHGGFVPAGHAGFVPAGHGGAAVGHGGGASGGHGGGHR